MKKRILIACEYSGIVRDAFTRAGHDATSCDLLPSETKGQHYQGKVEDILSQAWDMMIAFPPCTYLSRVQEHLVQQSQERKQKQIEGLEFVKMLMNAPIKLIAIENPPGAIKREIKPPDQIIRPWYFGDPHNKEICLWLKNLPPLISTVYHTRRQSVFNHTNGRMSQEQKSKIHSKFFPHVAEAMATQWSKYLTM